MREGAPLSPGHQGGRCREGAGRAQRGPWGQGAGGRRSEGRGSLVGPVPVSASSSLAVWLL